MPVLCRSASYSSHGLELLECSVWPEGADRDAMASRRCAMCRVPDRDKEPAEATWPLPFAVPQLHLFKLRGDPNVPAGKYSVVADLRTWETGVSDSLMGDAYLVQGAPLAVTLNHHVCSCSRLSHIRRS